MEKKWLVSFLQTVYFNLQYALNHMLGQTAENIPLHLDERYMILYRRLHEAFQIYDPIHRNFVASIFQRNKLVQPEGLHRFNAKWATDMILTIDRVYKGQLDPKHLMPLIEPWQIAYYYDRVNVYLEWLFHVNSRNWRIPMPFFHNIAAERLCALVKAQNVKVLTCENIPAVSKVAPMAVRQTDHSKHLTQIKKRLLDALEPTTVSA